MYSNIEYNNMTLTIFTIILFVTLYSILEHNYLNQEKVPCGWFSLGQSNKKKTLNRHL